LHSRPARSDDDDDKEDEEYLQKIREADFLTTELERVQGMEDILDELEEYYLETTAATTVDDDDDDDNDDDDIGNDDDDAAILERTDLLWSEQALQELLGDLPDDDDEEDDDDNDDFVGESSYDEDDDDEEDLEEALRTTTTTATTIIQQTLASNDKDDLPSLGNVGSSSPPSAFADLERALLEGVVPVSANVGSDCLPGDFGFDPLNLASKDYIRQTQDFFVSLLPEPAEDDESRSNNNNNNGNSGPRPRALILRDYREAEIRHGRLAMLAAIFWPLQEMLDRLLLDPDQAGPLLYGPVTLPYFPLLMTFIMLNLGYLDIYSQAIKDRDSIGEAFLPGDCFWDPLKILEGAPDSMKRNMQERELFNGRVAMLAVAAFTWEEAITHLPLVDVGDNQLLLEPAYQVPYIQEWLDNQFSPFDPPTDSTNLKMLMDEVLDTTLESLE